MGGSSVAGGASCRVTWWNAITGGRIDLEGVRHGDDVVQVGLRQGRPVRWTFTDIRADSFLWQGHILELDGRTRRLEVEIQARRERPRTEGAEGRSRHRGRA